VTGIRCERRSRNGGFRQIIIHRVIGRVDIDSASGRRFLKIGILESPEGLDLLVGGQLLAVLVRASPVPLPILNVFRNRDVRDGAF
jgi:hypothetical protein